MGSLSGLFQGKENSTGRHSRVTYFCVSCIFCICFIPFVFCIFIVFSLSFCNLLVFVVCCLYFRTFWYVGNIFWYVGDISWYAGTIFWYGGSTFWYVAYILLYLFVHLCICLRAETGNQSSLHEHTSRILLIRVWGVGKSPCKKPCRDSFADCLSMGLRVLRGVVGHHHQQV